MLTLDNTKHPFVPGIFPLNEKIKPHADDLHQDAMLDMAKLAAFYTKLKDDRLPRLDDPKKPPVIMQDEKGRDVLYQLWGNRAAPTDPRFMVILVSPKSVDESGSVVFKPEKMIRGPLANILIVGGMSCCGSSVQSFLSEVSDQGKVFREESRVPMGGLVHDEHAKWLDGKVLVAMNHQGLYHMVSLVKDVLAAQNPANPSFKITHDERNAYRQFIYS